ncbi:MAG: lasso peptide biosynthesis B2 protein [Anaerolineales bacterium]|nr:lasso peptide biosynthesis B2 protein [Anaerolineales bacterium]
MTLWHKLRKAGALSLREWGIFLEAWIFLLLVDLGLRLINYRRLKARLDMGQQNPGRRKLKGDALLTIKRLDEQVNRAARNHLYPMTCLRRSLVLQRMLAKRGIPTELHFGVRKQADGLVAHAWLEFEGQPIGQPETLTEQYAVLAGQGNRT